MNLLVSLLSALVTKIVGYFVLWFKKYQARQERNKAIKKATEALKNAKTPEEQENASAELIRVTTPID